MERVMGIEPTQPAWKAGVLPLNYTRISAANTIIATPPLIVNKKAGFFYFTQFQRKTENTISAASPFCLKKRVFILLFRLENLFLPSLSHQRLHG